ncbi:sulfatase-like hydrolase/transferase [Microbacterium sp. MPKO10]|nr:sulfatase-like hydrolase/transferase [Microbacterium sp. MPKO10]
MTRASSRRPNILLIMADQLGAHALDRDSEFVQTPNLDRLAASGAVFERAYVTFPLCVPSRASMLTGRMPHELRISGNSARSRDGGSEPARHPDSLGHVLGAAGYDCAFAGKWHATQPSAPPDVGFEMLRPFGDVGLADDCAAWIGERADAEDPFFLCASFDDPHTICEYARRQPMPYGDTTEVPLREAPPLPENFEPAPFEPEAVRYEKHAAQPMYGTGDYTPDDWRAYRSAYRQLIERVDGYVAQLLSALESAGLRENTIVIFTSDHGDGDASHRWNQKTALFEECTRVPLFVSGPGIRPARQTQPVSMCLDLLPTLCTLAGVEVPVSAELGASLLVPSEPESPPTVLPAGADSAHATPTSAPLPREAYDPPSPTGAAPHQRLCRPQEHDRSVVVETRFDRSDPPHTRGRALYSGRYKYVVYSWGRHREQLHDITSDPGERRNLAVESAFDGVVDDMRARLLEWCRKTGDSDALKYLVLPNSADDSIRREIFAVPY